MTLPSSKEKDWLLDFFSRVMTIVLLILILSVLITTLSMFLLPTPNEYEGRFPFEPEIFTAQFWKTLVYGILRHLALLQDHLVSSNIMRIVGQAFTVLLIYRIRGKIIDMKKGATEGMGIHEYVEWGFGSIISGIMLNIGYGRVIDQSSAMVILILSISAFIIYFVHPKLGILFAFKDYIKSKSEKKSEL